MAFLPRPEIGAKSAWAVYRASQHAGPFDHLAGVQSSLFVLAAGSDRYELPRESASMVCPAAGTDSLRMRDGRSFICTPGPRADSAPRAQRPKSRITNGGKVRIPNRESPSALIAPCRRPRRPSRAASRSPAAEQLFAACERQRGPRWHCECAL